LKYIVWLIIILLTAMSESESSYDFGNSLPHSKVSNKQLYY